MADSLKVAPIREGDGSGNHTPQVREILRRLLYECDLEGVVVAYRPRGADVQYCWGFGEDERLFAYMGAMERAKWLLNASAVEEDDEEGAPSHSGT